MTVEKLIKMLEVLPKDAQIYAEGEEADSISVEGYDKDGNPKEGFAQVVRIYKSLGVSFVVGEVSE